MSTRLTRYFLEADSELPQVGDIIQFDNPLIRGSCWRVTAVDRVRQVIEYESVDTGEVKTMSFVYFLSNAHIQELN